MTDESKITPRTEGRPETSQLSHVDEYKMLRDEITLYQNGISRMELAGGIAAGSIYTWLLLNKDKVSSHAVWYIVPVVLLICAVRCLDLTIRIKDVAKYILRIEDVAFEHDEKLRGFEHYKLTRPWLDFASTAFVTIGWLVMIGGSAFFSWWFSP
jgi:hypothetical protein